MKPQSADAPDLFGALRGLSGTTLAMLRSRLELAGLELGEARDRLLVSALLVLAVALLFALALGLLSAWLAWLAWPTTGPAVLGLLALGHGLAGALLLRRLRARLAAEPPLLADTLTELAYDARVLAGQGLPRPPGRSTDPP